MREPHTAWIIDSITEIKLSQKTGILTVWRGAGNNIEEGSIEFRQGQVISAKAGRKQGMEAVNLLSTWSNCQSHFGSAPLKNRPPSTPIPSAQYPGLDTDSLPGLQFVSPAEAQIPEYYEPANHIADKGISEIPYIVQSFDYGLRVIESQRLSRAHKRLFLLINSKRSILDLVRLLKLSPDEIYDLLNDLERANIIKLTTLSSNPRHT